MCTGKMARAFEKTKAWDPITPNIIEAIFKQDSKNVEGIGDALGWDQLERDAQWNQDNPQEGIANASLATGMGFATAGAGNMLGGSANAPVGVMAPGMENAAMMDSALINSGMSGAAGGTMTQAAGGLLGNMGVGKGSMGTMGKMGESGKKMMAQQGMGLLGGGGSTMQAPPPRTQSAPPPPQITLRDDPTGMGLGLTDEQKRKLRELGYPV